MPRLCPHVVLQLGRWTEEQTGQSHMRAFESTNGVVMKYRCKHCGKVVRRKSDKAWIPSYCEKTEKNVRLVRIRDVGGNGSLNNNLAN